MDPMMSGQRLSATEVFIDAVEMLCLREATLEHATEAVAALHDAGDLATAGTATLARLLHLFRARAGSRSAEWWIATLEGSKATALPSDLMLDVLVVLAADAGGVAVPQVASMERASFMPAYLQLAAVIVMLIHFHGGQSAPVTLQLLRDRSSTTGG
jgi:hypothetical protein